MAAIKVSAFYLCLGRYLYLLTQSASTSQSSATIYVLYCESM
jgi:hypothetical protein